MSIQVWLGWGNKQVDSLCYGSSCKGQSGFPPL